MSCPACGTENEPGGRFCEACGTPLAATCPSCGEPVRSDARFCRNCGSQIGADAPGPTLAPRPAADAPTAERRLVTVLFADLVGFTTLAEDRDPESTRELLTQYFDASREAIERHGGTVEKFIGDAVMAVWGTPIAHEDDAERAVRAALELVDAVRVLSPDLQARAGVLTGEAAVTLGATNQGMVAGDLVNTSARLQGVAEPGTVLVGEATMRAASVAVVFEEVGETALKGKVTPVPAWRAVRVVAARGGQQRADALEPPFIGRDEELRLLKDQLHAAGRDQRARLVSITGPGGIGKSRLVWEFEKYVDGLTETIWWHRGRSPSYGEGITFWALGEMVRRRAGLTEDDDDDTTRLRIAESVALFVSDPAERAMVEPALLALLGVGESPAGGRDMLFPAWRIYFERISEQATTALVFEDLQWADSGLLDFIDHLLDWSKSRPLLVITLSRPELFDRRPDWGAGRRTFTSLALDPLADDDIRALLEGVVPGLPPATLAAIVARAEGMPLYAVETVRVLLAEGRIERDGDIYRPVGDLEQLTVPESLRSLIASRLDALEPADRALLQDASVLGQVFNTTTLAAVTGSAEDDLEPRLKGLARRELLEVESDPRSPERGQYKFVQALIREVAYGTLALRDRRNRHLAIARHYEALGDDELAGALASHYVSAYEASAEGPEADAVAAQARIALRAASDRAAALGAHAQAVAYVDRALPLTTDPAERAELFERAALSSVAAASADPERYAREALAAAEAVGDPAGIQRAAALVGRVLLDLAEIPPAIEVLEEVMARDLASTDLAIEADLLVTLSRAHMRMNQTAQALDYADRALTIAEPLNLVRVVADAMNNRAGALAQVGRRREATALLEAAVTLAGEGGWTDLELRLMNNLSVTVNDDDPARGGQIQRDAREIAARIGNVGWYLLAVAGAASADIVEMREWAQALETVEEAVHRSPVGSMTWIQLVVLAAQLRAMRGEDPMALDADLQAHATDGLPKWWVDTGLADRHAIIGDDAVAAAMAVRALDSGLSDSNEPYLLMLLAMANVRLGRASEARAATDRLRDGVFQGSVTKAFHLASDAGTLALEGRTADARTRFTEGLAGLRQLQQLYDLARWSLAAATLMPDAPEAPGWIAEARELFGRVQALPYLELLDAIPVGAQPRAVSAAAATEAVPEPS
ncbi:MAG TPA: adenylate/guanylate cyclase domain-containing protein [Candidatus Limnocylindria bacterium]|jgi:class 3 adenylate cyclase/tetratricopeptide (TPR) repeat protein